MREGQLTFQHPQVQEPCRIPALPPLRKQSVSMALRTLSASNSIIAQLGTDPQYGITTGLPSNHTGVPFVDVSGGFAIGNGWEGELPQVGNSFMWADNLTWVKGNHQCKFGADVRRARFDQTLYYNVSGQFTFNGSTFKRRPVHDNYPGYLLGLADSYTQGSAQRENIRPPACISSRRTAGRSSRHLTLNYGLRWELDTPLTDVLHHVQTFRPGQNSTIILV